MIKYIMTEPSYEPSGSVEKNWWVRIAFITPSAPSEIHINLESGKTTEEALENAKAWVKAKLDQNAPIEFHEPSTI